MVFIYFRICLIISLAKNLKNSVFEALEFLQTLNISIYRIRRAKSIHRGSKEKEKQF